MPKEIRSIITRQEFDNLKWHFGTSSWWPYVFTEQGVGEGDFVVCVIGKEAGWIREMW